MQGRLCDQVDGMIQCFPWPFWKDEFLAAEVADLSLMEWTIDQERLYENPLMSAEGQRVILYLTKKHSIRINSLTGDCFMQAPFWKHTKSEQDFLKNCFLDIVKAASEFGIQIIVVPLVDNGRLENIEQETTLKNFLAAQCDYFRSCDIKILFETDFDPLNTARFINDLARDVFGINYDIGNSASLGYDFYEEIKIYGDRILNVHIKDRLLGGETVPLGTGAANLPCVFGELANIGYGGNFILQTARATDGDHRGAIKLYLETAFNLLVSAYGKSTKCGENAKNTRK